MLDVYKDGKLVVRDMTGAEFAPVVLEPADTPSLAAPESAIEILFEKVIVRLGMPEPKLSALPRSRMRCLYAHDVPVEPSADRCGD